MRGTNDGSGATPLVLMVRGVVLDAPPEIVRATVRERACRLGRTTLDVCFGARDEEALEALLGRQGSLLALGPASRAVHGIFTRVAIVGRRRRLDGRGVAPDAIASPPTRPRELRLERWGEARATSASGARGVCVGSWS